MTQPILSLNRLSQVFDGVTAVDALTVDIAKGEIFGFLGHNGAGKTTTVQMLTTLAKPASGTATVAGHDICADPLAVPRKLDGFTVPAGGKARIHLDDAAIAGHFRTNPNGIYVTSQAAKTFSVTLATDGFAPVTVEIAKDAGGAEAAD